MIEVRLPAGAALAMIGTWRSFATIPPEKAATKAKASRRVRGQFASDLQRRTGLAM
jgi:hypothetical protein